MAWESLGSVGPNLIWQQGPELGNADQPLTLLLTPSYLPNEEKTVAKVVFRREFQLDGLEPDILDPVDRAFGFYPQVSKGRIYTLEPIPVAISCSISFRFIKPRYLWGFDNATAMNSIQNMSILIEKLIS